MKKKHEMIIARHKPNWDGLPVMDAAGDIDISIRKADVSGANRLDPAACAVALACERMGIDAIVFQSVSYLCDGKVIRRYFNSRDLQHELRIFDEHDFFTPGAYTLLAPKGPHRLGQGRANTGTGKRMPLRHRRPLTLSVRRFE